jgi:hypothetical protein
VEWASATRYTYAAYPVDYFLRFFEEYEGRHEPGPFIAVYKGMIANDTRRIRRCKPPGTSTRKSFTLSHTQ